MIDSRIVSTSATERLHVLIVSDDPELQEFLAEGLLYGGFWTSTVASAIQTLEVFRLRSFDLVLIDAALAGLGALELLGRLRGRSHRAAPGAPRTDVAILLVAGDPGEIEPETATAAGADGVIAAPIELAELIPNLHAAVAAWRTAHPDRPIADVASQQGRAGPATEDGY